MRVAFIGAGRMGWPMALRLRDAGHEVRVLCRSSAAADRAIEAHVTATRATSDAVSEAEVVIVCVFSDAQVRELCLGSGGLLAEMAPGATLVVHTTGSPSTILDLAAAARELNISVSDATVSGGPDSISAGALTLFVAGSAAVVDKVVPVLSAYGSPILRVGALGNGQRVKLLNNSLFAANIGLVAEACRVGEALGIPQDNLLSAITVASGGSRAASLIAAMGSVEAFAESAGEFVGKDVVVARATASDLGVDLGLIAQILESAFVQEHLLHLTP